jgi:hypothetical protein
MSSTAKSISTSRRNTKPASRSTRGIWKPSGEGMGGEDVTIAAIIEGLPRTLLQRRNISGGNDLPVLARKRVPGVDCSPIIDSTLSGNIAGVMSRNTPRAERRID